ncbi:DUF397 domain-containing protein [Micromonospora sp. CA-248212]
MSVSHVDPSGPSLVATAAAWTAFLGGVKDAKLRP